MDTDAWTYLQSRGFRASYLTGHYRGGFTSIIEVNQSDLISADRLKSVLTEKLKTLEGLFQNWINDEKEALKELC